VVSEDRSAVGIDVAAQARSHSRPVEDVVAENQPRGSVSDEVGADDEGLRQAVGLVLHGEFEVDAVAGAVAEEPVEAGGVLGRGDDQNVLDAREHEGGHRIVDHRLVIDGHQLLGRAEGDGIESCAGPAGQNDSAHVF
jgi:hypothetical protein